MSRLRNGKGRLVLGLALATLALLVMCVIIHDTRTKLALTRVQMLECEHKRESLAAQLQVVGEHKSRLEKGLQQEKSSHTHTKDKLESQYEELQEQMDKEKQEAMKKYSLLQQQSDALQTQQENLQKEFSELQQTNAELQQEKRNLANKLTSQLDQLRITKDDEMLQLQNAYTALLGEKEELLKKLDKSSVIRQLEANVKECKEETSILRGKLGRLETAHLSMVGSPVLEDLRLPPDLNVVKVDGDADKHERAYVASMQRLQNGLSNLQHQMDEQDQKRVGPPPPLNGPHNLSISSSRKNLAAAVVGVDKPVNTHKDEGGRQLEEPNGHGDDSDRLKRSHQLPEPPFAQMDPIGREIKQGVERPFRREAELVANGLEQQENGEDQDLDNMENEVGAGAGNDRKENNRFEDADFDQADQDDNDGNRINNPQFQGRQEGVIVAPHK